MGFRTRKDDPHVAFMTATLYFDRDDEVVTGGMDARSYFEHLQKTDATISVPDDFVMAARVAVLMRGIASHCKHRRLSPFRPFPWECRFLACHIPALCTLASAQEGGDVSFRSSVTHQPSAPYPQPSPLIPLPSTLYPQPAILNPKTSPSPTSSPNPLGPFPFRSTGAPLKPALNPKTSGKDHLHFGALAPHRGVRPSR